MNRQKPLRVSEHNRSDVRAPDPGGVPVTQRRQRPSSVVVNEEAGAMRRGKAVTLFTTDQAVHPDLRMTREAFSTKVEGTPVQPAPLRHAVLLRERHRRETGHHIHFSTGDGAENLHVDGGSGRYSDWRGWGNGARGVRHAEALGISNALAPHHE